MDSSKRSFLFLQGPQSRFFRKLGIKLVEQGHKVLKINFCGGDIFIWPRPNTAMFRKSMYEWPHWVKNIMEQENITDLVLFGDRRPMHHEAIHMARMMGINVFALEEGYLQPGFITVERDGVNGKSQLPCTAEAVQKLAKTLPEIENAPSLPSSMPIRVNFSYIHHIGNTLLFGLFPHYRTHRPYPILWEVQGIYPRNFMRKKRMAWSAKQQERALNSEQPFFLFPLQLDSDTQVRQYSDFTGIIDSIAHVMFSFARFAPEEALLVIKNHPVDNGLINYRRYIKNLALTLGIEERVIAMEEGNGQLLMEKSQGMVLINSTMGLEGLQMGKPVYCLGDAIYAFPGMAVTKVEKTLDVFWENPRPPAPELVSDFIKVLSHKVLVRGNYYTDEGIDSAINGTLEKFEISPQNKH